MREISSKEIKNAVKNLFLQACIAPNDDIECALKNALETETNECARSILSQIIENNKLAKAENMPCCQDTGMAVVFLEIGQEVLITGDYLENAVNEGVREAYGEGYFRKSVLTPITRINTGDNTPAIIHTRIVPGDKIKITAAPKGFGSENMSAIKMCKPSEGAKGIVDFVVDTAVKAGGSPCPPVVLGVGIGGTFEHAAFMAKRQLTRSINSKNPDPMLAEMEKEIKDKINALKIGPMGLGGDTYCLKVNIEQFYTHLAGMPVAVNYCCHALRHKEVTL